MRLVTANAFEVVSFLFFFVVKTINCPQVVCGWWSGAVE